MIKLKAYAKLNLALDILFKRTDGYHELDTIMQNISLHDIVTIEKANGIRVHMDKGEVTEHSNTAHLAAKVFMQRTDISGADISIEKRIPSMSGLGGSSVDAAAVLFGLNALYDTKLDERTLFEIGKEVGADVPFALLGGTARVTGLGEKLERMKLKKQLHFVVVKPYQGVSTAKAFAAYRKASHISIDSVQYAVQKGDIALIQKFCANALGMAALSIAPDIIKAAAALAHFSKAFMSGSGSSMFAVFETQDEAKAAADAVHGDFELCGAYSSTSKGVEIIGENF